MNTSEITCRIYLNFLYDLNKSYFPELLSIPEAVIARSKVLQIIENLKKAVRANSYFHFFNSEAINYYWHPEILWYLVTFDLVNIKDYLQLIETSDVSIANTVEDLSSLLLNSPNSAFCMKVQCDFVSFLSEYSTLESPLINVITTKIYENVITTDVPNENFLNILQVDNLEQLRWMFQIVEKSFTTNGSNSKDVIGTEQLQLPSQSKGLTSFYNKLSTSKNVETVIDLFSNFLINVSPESKLNWTHIAAFVLSILKAQGVQPIKSTIASILEHCLNQHSIFHLHSTILLGRVITCKDANIGLSYLQWFANTFSSTSDRPLNTTEKAKFFLSSLTDILYIEPPCYTKVHLNKVPSVPSASQKELSLYLQQAKICLQSLNESTEIGIFENTHDSGAAENDVKRLVEQFKSNGKIPQNFLAALAFRRGYFKKELLPTLLSTCEGCQSAHHKIILLLAKSGEISENLLSKHLETCIRT